MTILVNKEYAQEFLFASKTHLIAFSKPPLRHAKHMLTNILHIVLIIKSPSLLFSLVTKKKKLSQVFLLYFFFLSFFLCLIVFSFLCIPMKFGKRLKQQIEETLPGWQDKFLSYKKLKRLVRLISSSPTLLNRSLEFGKTEAKFVYLLNNEIEKFNSFFMEQEEDFIIRHKVRYTSCTLIFN